MNIRQTQTYQNMHTWQKIIFYSASLSLISIPFWIYYSIMKLKGRKLKPSEQDDSMVRYVLIYQTIKVSAIISLTALSFFFL